MSGEVTWSKCLKFSSSKKKKKSLFLLSDIWSVYIHLISPENNYRILPILKRKKKSSLFFFNLLNDCYISGMRKNKICYPEMHISCDKVLPTQFPKFSVISHHLWKINRRPASLPTHLVLDSFHFPGFKSEFVSVLLRQTKDAMSIK